VVYVGLYVGYSPKGTQLFPLIWGEFMGLPRWIWKPLTVWQPESGKSLKLWYEKIRDKLPGFYDVLIWTRRERERENSFLKCSDWLKLIQSFFWNVLSLEPWKFLGTFRQVNIKRGEEGVEAFRIKGEWQHLSAFAQKSILLQYIKWLQIYEINI